MSEIPTSVVNMAYKFHFSSPRPGFRCVPILFTIIICLIACLAPPVAGTPAVPVHVSLPSVQMPDTAHGDSNVLATVRAPQKSPWCLASQTQHSPINKVTGNKFFVSS